VNGEAADHESVTDMIRQTWPNYDDEFHRDLVGILTADSGALTELAEAIDARSATPDDAYALWCNIIGSLGPDTITELGNWDGDLDGCNYLLQVVSAW